MDIIAYMFEVFFLHLDLHSRELMEGGRDMGER